MYGYRRNEWKEITMEFQLYFQMIKRGWWVILLGALVAMVMALVFAYFAIPQYQATARFVIVPNSTLKSGADVIDGLDVLDRVTVMSTYAEVMNSERVYSDSLNLLNIDALSVLEYRYQATVLPNTSILELSVIGPNPKLVTALANTIGYTSIDFTRRMNQPFDISFLDMATIPAIPVSPQPVQDAGVAFALGIIGGAALVILREQIRLPLESYRQRFRIDNVTGVYNNRSFPRLIEEEIANSPDDLHSIGLIELSGLRDFFGTLPLASLNSILQTVTKSLKKELRGNDLIGKWKDDTFVVLLPNTSGAAANTIFERIFQALAVPIELKQLDTLVNLDPHIGGAEYSNDITIDELLRKADETLNFARRDNTNPIYVWRLNNPFWATP